ncbi:MAG: hypothetical protein H6Q59_2617 [Firmicutes bacterium]|nr:hypothetical protein [Bacillota bacterium]
MTCNKAQSMITPFINNKLTLKDLEDFINHVSTCSVCREELEVYYALLTAMKQLDEDKNLSSDFGMELDQKLERAKERIFRAKFTYYRKKIILFLTIIILAFIFSIGYANKGSEIRTVTESSFRMRYSFHGEVKDDYEALLQEYLKRQKLSPVPTKTIVIP